MCKLLNHSTEQSARTGCRLKDSQGRSVGGNLPGHEKSDLDGSEIQSTSFALSAGLARYDFSAEAVCEERRTIGRNLVNFPRQHYDTLTIDLFRSVSTLESADSIDAASLTRSGLHGLETCVRFQFRGLRIGSNARAAVSSSAMLREWWRDAIFYQIYPRSFADSNGDGIGDLDGITAHLDYLNDGTAASLGIDALWLSPINPSPLKDWGYDVSDYCDVHPDLGTLKSFDRLIAEAHRRGIRIILDLVPNHTSDQHPWFRESRSSRDNPKRDWYLWRRGLGDGPPNNWVSNFGGSAWEFDAVTGEWYLRSFLREQADLNFRNPAVVEAMHDVIRFWLDRGADGFRVDVIAQLIKDADFRDNPPVPKDASLSALKRMEFELRYNCDQPEVHDVIRGFRRVVDSYPGTRMMVGEVWPREQRSLADYLRPDELQQAFNFRFLFSKWSAGAFRRRIEEVESFLGADAWPTYTLSNHDFPRHITRYASVVADAQASARMAAVMLLTMRGTPFIYYGEEIGMPDVVIPADRKRDPVERDGCRTPMQWTADRNGGFTTGADTWLPMGDCAAINVARQLRDPSSMLSLYRRIIHMRKHSRALSEGSYRTEANAPEDCLVYRREAASERMMVALNFTGETRRLEVPRASIVLSSDPGRRESVVEGAIDLGAHEGVILQLK